MRLLATLAASAALSSLATSAALADPSGYVGVGGGLSHIDQDLDGYNAPLEGSALQFLASGVYMFTPVLGVQGDIRAAFQTHDGDWFQHEDASLDGAVHGFYREAGQYLVGAFFQFGGNRVTADSLEIDASRNYAGAEGQVYLDNLTLYGQVGLQQTDISNATVSIGMDGWFGTLEARYFLTPDFRIDAHVGLSAYDIKFLYEVTVATVNVGVGAEYKLENLPVSLFATYDFYASDADGNVETTLLGLDQQRVMVGAKFSIGEDSLFARDRSGASLKPVESPMNIFTVPSSAP